MTGIAFMLEVCGSEIGFNATDLPSAQQKLYIYRKKL